MSQNIDDILSIFRVSGLLDTIFANESHLLVKSGKIGKNREKLPNIGNISIND